MSKKCLILDDVEVCRYVIGETMKELGYAVAEAGGEDETLDQLENDRFDVIFLDWHLGKSNGLGLVPKIREMPGSSTTPIIVCSGVEQDFSGIQGSGVQGFLRKPISPERLREELRRLAIAS